MSIPPMKQFIRTGAYALIIQNEKILLTLQKAGPSEGLWHLPGGGIEFSETPLEALQRELEEEAALKIIDPTFLTIVSHHGEYRGIESYRYHYIGLVYRVNQFGPTNLTAQDESRWFPIQTLDLSQTSRFVQQLREEKFF